MLKFAPHPAAVRTQIDKRAIKSFSEGRESTAAAAGGGKKFKVMA
jgi:hypothetical protein